MHFDTGLLWVDVEDDFNRARRRQMLARLAGWLRGQPGHASRILSLDEVVAALGWRGEHHLGLQTIQLDTVAGTETLMPMLYSEGVLAGRISLDEASSWP
jgi:hypothetical protein